MNKRPIDRAVAKVELERINAHLEQPHLLIGGLAVQQFYAARNSKDIDLVCDFETAQRLVDRLYPSDNWIVEDKQNDEYRPSFHIRHRINDLGIIIFGPKISEREPYNYVDWEALKNGAVPFRTANGPLANILVPTVHALAYTKFISFLGRRSPSPKIEADLNDFVNLTNDLNFSASQFYDLLRRTGSINELHTFRIKCQEFTTTIKKSCLFGLAAMFDYNRTTEVDRPITVWVIGSTNDLPRKNRTWAFKVADALADEFVARCYRVVLGRNHLLASMADRLDARQVEGITANVDFDELLAKKSARAGGTCPNPVIVLGSLRSGSSLRELFTNAIGTVPDVAVVIGGNPNGRGLEEARLAEEAAIPLLPLPLTGGLAAALNATCDFSLSEQVLTVQNMTRGSDVIGRRVCEIVEGQVWISRQPTLFIPNGVHES